VANVHGIATRAAPRVQQEVLAALIGVQYQLQVAVREEQPPPQPAMRLVTSHALESLQQRVVYEFRGPFLRDGVVVEFEDVSVGVDSSLHVPRVDLLLRRLGDGLGRRVGKAQGSHSGRLGFGHA
jgi:hypothetical protein